MPHKLYHPRVTQLRFWGKGYSLFLWLNFLKATLFQTYSYSWELRWVLGFLLSRFNSLPFQGFPFPLFFGYCSRRVFTQLPIWPIIWFPFFIFLCSKPSSQINWNPPFLFNNYGLGEFIRPLFNSSFWLLPSYFSSRIVSSLLLPA